MTDKVTQELIDRIIRKYAGLSYFPTQDVIDDVRSAMDEQKSTLLEKVEKMLWSIHVSEKDGEDKAYNDALDRAVFKLLELTDEDTTQKLPSTK